MEMTSSVDLVPGVDNCKRDEEFCSCCADDEVWQDTEESFAGSGSVQLDETAVKMFFKGVSTLECVENKVSGIGVVMERAAGPPLVNVQKRLEFHVHGLVAEHLALLDGLLAAIGNGVRKVYAFTDSEKLYFQITEAEILDDQLLVALGHRILELVDKLEDFDLTLVPSSELERPSRLAKEAAGLMYQYLGEAGTCPICLKEKQSFQMIKMICSHKFCSCCLSTYVENKLRSLKASVRCPNRRCKYYLSASECKSFLPVSSHGFVDKIFAADSALNLERFYCPFPDCLVLIDLRQHFSSLASSSNQSVVNCAECPECHKDICISCGVPWHSEMSCDEYQRLPAEEREMDDLSLHQLLQNNRWRRCQRCTRLIELQHGCYHMTCWCGHEFCYVCGVDYRNGIQNCQCAYWDDDTADTSGTNSSQGSDIWAWDTFDFLPSAIEGYSEQERSQLALIQRFLAGGFSLGDHPCQSPPRCSEPYVDTMKDLHELPWLERFVSVISDNYNDGYIQ